MIRTLLLTLLMLAGMLANAQVTINVQLPSGGLVQKDAFWNLVLVNNNNSPDNEVFVTLDVQDALTGQTVLSAVSRGFTMGKGVKVISVRDVQPIQYNYVAGELTGTYMALGNYIACYRVLRADQKQPTPLGDDCSRVSIAPLSPPLLNLPEDKSIQLTSYPQFSWLPPTPVTMFSGLNYDLIVTEVMPGQPPSEAVLNNTPVLTRHNLKNTFEMYPASFAGLKDGQQYAWQVVARSGLTYAAQTETWAFTVKKTDSANTAVSNGAYIILTGKKQASGISSVQGEKMAVQFYSFDKDHTAQFRFLTADGKVITQMSKKIKYGNNLIQFRINQKFEQGTIYVIELTDLKKNIYSAKFSIQ